MSLNRFSALRPRLPLRTVMAALSPHLGLRLAAVGLGCLAILWGGWLLVVAAPSATHPGAVLLWLAAGLLVHDALFAPLVLVLGLVVARFLPSRGRRITGGVALVLGSLVLVGAAGWLKP